MSDVVTPLSSVDQPASAIYFVTLLRLNVDNTRMTDEEFRQFIRNTLPIVERPE